MRPPLPLLGGPLLAHDISELRRLRASGLLSDLRPLEALVALRRARRYGDGPRALVAAVNRPLEVAR